MPNEDQRSAAPPRDDAPAGAASPARRGAATVDSRDAETDARDADARDAAPRAAERDAQRSLDDDQVTPSVQYGEDSGAL